jgi:hypothetical protein
MARYNNELKDGRAELKLYKKRSDSAFKDLTEAQAAYVREALAKVAEDAIENARHELLDCGGAYIETGSLFDNHNYPCPISEPESYSNLMLLFAALVIPDLDPFSLIQPVEPIKKGLSLHRFMEASYYKLLIPSYVDGFIEKYYKLDRICSRLMLSRNVNRQLMNNKNMSDDNFERLTAEAWQLESGINALKLQLSSLLAEISVLCDTLYPVTEAYYESLEASRTHLSEVRSAASKSGHTLWSELSDAVPFLGEFYRYMYAELVAKNKKISSDAVIQSCLYFIQGRFFASDLLKAKLTKYLNGFRASYKAHTDKELNDEQYRKFLVVVSTAYHRGLEL